METLPKLNEEQYEALARLSGRNIKDVKKIYAALMTPDEKVDADIKELKKAGKTIGSFLLSVASGATTGAVLGVSKIGVSSAIEQYDFPLPVGLQEIIGKFSTGAVGGAPISYIKRYRSWLFGYALTTRLAPNAFQQLISLYDENFSTRPDSEKTAIVNNVSGVAPFLTAAVLLVTGGVIGAVSADFLRKKYGTVTFTSKGLEDITRPTVDRNNIAALLEAGQSQYRESLMAYVTDAVLIATGTKFDPTIHASPKEFLATTRWNELVDKLTEAGEKNDKETITKLFQPLLDAANAKLSKEVPLTPNFSTLLEYLTNEYPPLTQCLIRQYPNEFMTDEINQYQDLEKQLTRTLTARATQKNKDQATQQYIDQQKAKHSPISLQSEADKVILDLNTTKKQIEQLNRKGAIQSMTDEKLRAEFEELLATQRRIVAKQTFAPQKLVSAFLSALPAAKKAAEKADRPVTDFELQLIGIPTQVDKDYQISSEVEGTLALRMLPTIENSIRDYDDKPVLVLASKDKASKSRAVEVTVGSKASIRNDGSSSNRFEIAKTPMSPAKWPQVISELDQLYDAVKTSLSDFDQQILKNPVRETTYIIRASASHLMNQLTDAFERMELAYQRVPNTQSIKADYERHKEKCIDTFQKVQQHLLDTTLTTNILRAPEFLSIASGVRFINEMNSEVRNNFLKKFDSVIKELNDDTALAKRSMFSWSKLSQGYEIMQAVPRCEHLASAIRIQNLAQITLKTSADYKAALRDIDKILEYKKFMVENNKATKNHATERTHFENLGIIYRIKLLSEKIKENQSTSSENSPTSAQIQKISDHLNKTLEATERLLGTLNISEEGNIDINGEKLNPVERYVILQAMSSSFARLSLECNSLIDSLSKSSKQKHSEMTSEFEETIRDIENIGDRISASLNDISITQKSLPTEDQSHEILQKYSLSQYAPSRNGLDDTHKKLTEIKIEIDRLAEDTQSEAGEIDEPIPGLEHVKKELTEPTDLAEPTGPKRKKKKKKKKKLAPSTPAQTSKVFQPQASKYGGGLSSRAKPSKDSASQDVSVSTSSFEELATKAKSLEQELGALVEELKKHPSPESMTEFLKIDLEKVTSPYERIAETLNKLGDVCSQLTETQLKMREMQPGSVNDLTLRRYRKQRLSYKVEAARNLELHQQWHEKFQDEVERQLEVKPTKPLWDLLDKKRIESMNTKDLKHNSYKPHLKKWKRCVRTHIKTTNGRELVRHKYYLIKDDQQISAEELAKNYKKEPYSAFKRKSEADLGIAYDPYHGPLYGHDDDLIDKLEVRIKIISGILDNKNFKLSSDVRSLLIEAKDPKSKVFSQEALNDLSQLLKKHQDEGCKLVMLGEPNENSEIPKGVVQAGDNEGHFCVIDPKVGMQVAKGNKRLIIGARSTLNNAVKSTHVENVNGVLKVNGKILSEHTDTSLPVASHATGVGGGR